MQLSCLLCYITFDRNTDRFSEKTIFVKEDIIK